MIEPFSELKVSKPKLPFEVLLISLIQLISGSAILFLFLQGWGRHQGELSLAGSSLEDFLLSFPLFFFLPVIGVFFVGIGLGLLTLSGGARRASILPLFAIAPLWYFKGAFEVKSMLLPFQETDQAVILLVEAVALALLYLSPGAKEAFAKAKKAARLQEQGWGSESQIRPLG